MSIDPELVMVYATAAEWLDEQQRWELHTEDYGPLDLERAQQVVVMLANQERIRGATIQPLNPAERVE